MVNCLDHRTPFASIMIRLHNLDSGAVSDLLADLGSSEHETMSALLQTKCTVCLCGKSSETLCSKPPMYLCI